MQTFRNEPTAAPRTNVNARKTNSWMDDNAIKSPGSVTFVYVGSNAVHEKQLPSKGRRCDFKFLQAHRLICAKVTARGVTLTSSQAGQPWIAKASIAFHSAGVNLIFMAAMFSSKCTMDEMPGIGSITGERSRIQTRAIWTTLAP
jgi:hypothetical protein